MKKPSVIPLLLLTIFGISTIATVYVGQHNTDNRSKAASPGAYAPFPTMTPNLKNITPTQVPVVCQKGVCLRNVSACHQNGQCVNGGNCFYDRINNIWTTIGRCTSNITPTQVPVVCQKGVCLRNIPECHQNGQCVNGGNCFYDRINNIWTTIGKCGTPTSSPTMVPLIICSQANQAQCVNASYCRWSSTHGCYTPLSKTTPCKTTQWDVCWQCPNGSNCTGTSSCVCI